MFKNYVNVAIRNIRRYSTYSILNIIGLAIGMACAILILLWVQDEWSYDRHFKNADNLYRVIGDNGAVVGEHSLTARTPAPMARALKEEYPEIIRSSRCGVGSLLSFKMGDKFIEETAVPIDNDFLKMLDIRFVAGDINTALKAPNNMVITEKIAQKYFGNESPVGRTLKMTESNEIYTITGIVKTPHNTHLLFDILIPIKLRPEFESLKSDMQLFCYNYIELKEGTNGKTFENKIRNFLKERSSTMIFDISLQNIKRIHLFSSGKYEGDIEGHGDITFVRILSIIAIFILIIACINFMNLSTAQLASRSKEIGLRKIAGAGRQKIIFQFLGESFLIVFVAHLIAMILVELFLPGLNNLTGKQMSVNYQSAGLYIGLLSIVLFCSLLAGSYPALHLSSLQPMNIMKGIIKTNPVNAQFRRVLVIFQFSLSILLIICTLIIENQYNYIQSKKLGFNKDNIVYFASHIRSEDPRLESLKKELINNPNILSVSRGDNPVNDKYIRTTNEYNWVGKERDNNVQFDILDGDADYAKTFQLEMKDGRFFSNEFIADSSAVVINETAAKIMSIKDPVGKIITDSQGNKSTIIGVVKDFHYKSMHYKIDPLLMISAKSMQFFIRMKPGTTTSTINFINRTFYSFDLPFRLDLHFLDEDYANLYRNEQHVSKIFGNFSLLAIIISCLGLIGLSSFLTERRTKEIGIRKINGAKSYEIFSMLSWEYELWVLFSILIACPIAWYAMQKWLQNFAYRVSISWWIFAMVGVIALLIALLTVTWQSYKAARRNPVDALRYE
jgi:putative ABC transport system permease protein